MTVKRALRRTGRPGRVTGNQRTGACGRRAPVAGRDPINIIRANIHRFGSGAHCQGRLSANRGPSFAVRAHHRFASYNLAPAMGGGDGRRRRSMRSGQAPYRPRSSRTPRRHPTALVGPQMSPRVGFSGECLLNIMTFTSTSDFYAAIFGSRHRRLGVKRYNVVFRAIYNE